MSKQQATLHLYPGPALTPTHACQGHCCPVYTERKTGQPSGVVSVAVKAIAVAASYVANNGGAHHVAFQPYARSAAGGTSAAAAAFDSR